jgi:hypothetical protein
MTDLHRIFAALDGAHIPGGCTHCNAEQIPSLDAVGILHITIEHDDQCPVLQQMRT